MVQRFVFQFSTTGETSLTSRQKLRLAIEREKRVIEGANAMREYKADQAEFLAKGDRLRAERLAMEALLTAQKRTTRPNKKSQDEKR
ncbi:MAG: hypothetical protein E6Q98_04490 [Rhodospirillaceae bacterium]|nr:MAG: hypothetical protein E6Q98_04490 [Rhodospirillaceae bacterium]